MPKARNVKLSQVFHSSFRRLQRRLRVRVSGVLVDAFLDFVTEMADEALDWPSRRVAKRADRVTFHLVCHFQQHIDLALLRPALRHPREHAPHPAGSLPTGRALAAAFVLVEV